MPWGGKGRALQKEEGRQWGGGAKVNPTLVAVIFCRIDLLLNFEKEEYKKKKQVAFRDYNSDSDNDNDTDDDQYNRTLNCIYCTVSVCCWCRQRAAEAMRDSDPVQCPPFHTYSGLWDCGPGPNVLSE